MKYICKWDRHSLNTLYGEGNTLVESFNACKEATYESEGENISVDECIFYESNEIKVATRIEKVEVPVKSPRSK